MKKVNIKVIIAILIISMIVIVSPTQLKAAAGGPPVTYPAQNSEYGFYSMTLQWNSPSSSYGTVNYYKIFIRNLKQDTLIVNGNTTSSRSYTIPTSLLSQKTRYRFSICAVMTDGVQRWSDERYFYISSHNGINTTPLTLVSWSGFTYDTKIGVYYACQAWDSAIGTEVVNTPPTTTVHNDNTINNNDGNNRVTGVSQGLNGNLATTYYRYYTSNKKVIEADININKSYPWVNSSMSGYYDVQNVITHEVGHVVGLCDIYDSWATEITMYGSASTGEIKKRTLETHDTVSANHLY